MIDEFIVTILFFFFYFFVCNFSRHSHSSSSIRIAIKIDKPRNMTLKISNVNLAILLSEAFFLNLGTP